MSDTFDNFPISFENARTVRCYRAWCTRVVDGDTYDLILDLGLTVRAKIRVRLKDFDTAEYFHPSNPAERLHAEQAIMFVQRLILDKPCLIRTFWTKSGTDVVTVGRYVADVYYITEDGVPINIVPLMTDAGLAKRESY